MNNLTSGVRLKCWYDRKRQISSRIIDCPMKYGFDIFFFESVPIKEEIVFAIRSFL